MANLHYDASDLLFLTPPPEAPFPICPVCGEETDTYYKNDSGEIVGCDHCVRTVDAWEEET